ncbi:helix-turn-helix domain-containing protein [uncultured Treponema sp.]|uniref:helix-turn-helix domain-containing protein n=1 Tax=uncultured Treponema sp. TaxID=162155 RepID=UPI0025ECA61D|nr:helix-turn-helix domain-containing protein [uncultured Treponema sp.]
MNFWEKVDQERELKNLTRKELAHIAKFSLNSISTGIARNSIPAADVALRIANALGTTVECLMGQKNSQQATPPQPIISAKKEALYKKYHILIEDFDKLSPENQKAIMQIVRQIAH